MGDMLPHHGRMPAAVIHTTFIIMGRASARFSEIFIKEETSDRGGLGVIDLLPAIGKT
jgi:hypothetical protein